MHRSQVAASLVALLGTALGCDPSPIGTDSLVPPPPPPAALTLTVNPLSRRATAPPGATAPGDNAVITFSGENANSAAWTATKKQPWTTLLASSGTGAGTLAWTRIAAGLGAGVYVDTITITAPGAVGSPVGIVDTLQITTVAVSLSLAVSPGSRSASVIQGAAAPGDNVAVLITGDGAAGTTWTVTNRATWTSLASAVGTGSGSVAWTRNAVGLTAGTYVDTMTITAPGATGSPVDVIDTMVVTPLPVALVVTLSPASHTTSVTAGGTAPSGTATITITGTGSATASWTASRKQSWTLLTSTAGTGSGHLAWHRDPTGLVAGIYVDTITVVAGSTTGAQARFIDSLIVTAPPVPLRLTVSPGSRLTSVNQGGAAAGGSATVTLTGDNAAAAAWTATKRKPWTTLILGTGTGSGTVSWNRDATGLAAGVYVDSITVTTAGAVGSPALVIDTLQVTPPGNQPDLGLNADLHGKQIFPVNDLWNRPVDTAQVDPGSALILGTIGLTKSLHPDFGASYGGGPFGIAYVVVDNTTPRYTVPFTYASESDPGPYPIPANPPIEPGDGHLLVINRNEWKLYELFSLSSNGSGGWRAGSGAIFDLTTNTHRPAGWTSADAAGLPILPGLVRYDEVYQHGAIDHALRFTVQHTRASYVAPASHVASSLSGLQYAPMGMRVRLKASFDISGYSAQAQVILRALKKYGMMVADNGSDFYLSGTADARWNDDVNNTLKQVKVGDFEVVRMMGVVTP